tara:strand:- start:466 stop:705 length:240 start_codon:yes stop_codon:yes gene_type:complete
MNNESIKRLLETLMALKVTLRDTAEPSMNCELDEAIAELQLILESNESSELTHAKALELLGKVFSSLPSIAKLIESFYG